MKNKLGIAIVLLAVIFYIGYNYIYHDHRDINTEKAQFSLTGDSLYQHFIQNQEEASKLYINQPLELSGVLYSKSEFLIVLSPGIVCQVDSSFLLQDLEIGDSLRLKGRCIGFDDLFMEVKMDNITAN